MISNISITYSINFVNPAWNWDKLFSVKVQYKKFTIVTYNSTTTQHELRSTVNHPLSLKKEKNKK